MTKVKRGLLLLIVLQTTVAGCSGKAKDQPNLGRVTGTVTLDGQPFPNAAVHFMPTEGRSSFGVTDASGNYVMGYLPNVFGAKVGKHKVAIKTFVNDEASPEGMYGEEKIPKKYWQETILTAEVKPGNNVSNFDLISEETPEPGATQ